MELATDVLQCSIGARTYMHHNVKLWILLISSVCVCFISGRVGTVSVGKKVYVIGGYDGGANLSSMEVYDIENQEWTLAQPMAKHYGAVGVAVIQ